MVEKIEEIAVSIQNHRKLEASIKAINLAVSRSLVVFENARQLFWLVNNENIGGSVPRYDFSGNIVCMDTGPATTYARDGKPIYKNTLLGEVLIYFHEGTRQIRTPGGNRELTIYNRATYIPNTHNQDIADIVIRLDDDPIVYSFRTIREILFLQVDIDKSREELTIATEGKKEEEAKKLLLRIEDKEREKQIHLAKAQNFIRKNAELRYQPILDPQQESMKRSLVFDGVLIINGGPGTGKTTSLIQRIKFLTSSSIKDYYKLTPSQEQLLTNQRTSWIFYSPSELLALFLRNSMIKEGLEADTERVKVWARHKNELVKTYQFVNESKRPFLIYNKSKNEGLFINTAAGTNAIINELNNFYIAFQKEKIDKVVALNITAFYWKNRGLSIQKYLRERNEIKNLDELIRLFLNINELYKSDSEAIAQEYSTLIRKVVSRIQVLVQNESERTDNISIVLKNWKSELQDLDEEDDEVEIEQDDFDEKEEQTSFDFEKEFFTKLKSICRKQALKKFDKGIRFNKRERELFQLIPEIESQSEYDRIGQTAFFVKFFERIIKGISPNIFREIPVIYKKFRRSQLSSNSVNWNIPILEEIVRKDKNVRLHADDQALLLFFTNSISFRLAGLFKDQYNAINHPYVNGFKANCKAVIGVDEATDFSLIDIVAIHSFRHPDLSSVSLSGDIMQRITSEGLLDWADITKVIPNCQRRDLKFSYRQSPTLLSLARTIYEKSTGKKANYISRLEKDENEPKPLIFISADEDEKLTWISDRILEIYRAYGESIPSIAIFLPEESQLEQFSEKLGNLDTLADVGIPVQACRQGQVLGERAAVRVFSVRHIKGLEFEAVFFHNIDNLQNQSLNSGLLLRYLYVGLSRATFYLGITLSGELSKDISFLEGSFETDGKTWAI